MATGRTLASQFLRQTVASGRGLGKGKETGKDCSSHSHKQTSGNRTFLPQSAFKMISQQIPGCSQSVNDRAEWSKDRVLGVTLATRTNNRHLKPAAHLRGRLCNGACALEITGIPRAMLLMETICLNVVTSWPSLHLLPSSQQKIRMV